MRLFVLLCMMWVVNAEDGVSVFWGNLYRGPGIYLICVEPEVMAVANCTGNPILLAFTHMNIRDVKTAVGEKPQYQLMKNGKLRDGEMVNFSDWDHCYKVKNLKPNNENVAANAVVTGTMSYTFNKIDEIKTIELLP